MIIWLTVIVPITILGVSVYKWKSRYTWWEILIQLAIPIAVIALTKYLVEIDQTTDTEYWGGWGVRAEYYEKWDEEVSCQHPIYVTSTDSDGNTTSTYVGDAHSYDVDNHPPYWEIDDSNGQSIRITQALFTSLTKRWGNNKEVDLRRDYHSYDGDKWVTTWDLKKETLEPCTTVHSYENRVAVSDSIFNFREIENPQETGVYEYPSVNRHHQKTVLGSAGSATMAGEREVAYWNSTLGRKNQVRLFVLIYKDQPLEVAMDQEAYWKGGNKNELVSCVGVDKDYNVQWSYVFSWSKSETLKVEARDFLAEQKTLDIAAYAAWLGPQIEKRWERLPFEQFNYLTVSPSWWAIIIAWIVQIIVSVLLALWAVKNQYDFGGIRRRFSWRTRRY